DRKYVLFPAILFLISGIVSFLVTPYKLQTFEPGLLRRIIYVGTFIVILYEFDRENDFKRVLKWMVWSLLLVVGYGLVQAFGRDWHIWAGAFPGIFSTFGNPNFFAAWLVLTSPLIFARAFLTKKWYWVPVILAILYCLYRSGAKGGWLGIGVAITSFVIFSTLYLIDGNPKILKRIAMGITVGVMIFVITAISIGSMHRITSIRFRLFTWGSTMKMISEPVFVSPAQAFFFGHGIETFRIVYPAYRRPEIFHIEGKHNTQTDHAHNEFLEVFYDEGILGLTVFLWLLFSVLYMAVKRLSLIGIGGEKTEDDYYLVGVLSGIIGVLFHAAVDVNPRFVSTGYVFWVMLGLLVVHSAPKHKNTSSNFTPSYKAKPFLIFPLVLLAFYSSLLASRRFTANIEHNKAIAASRQRDWNKALDLYGKVKKYHPSFIMAYYFEGNVYNDQLSDAIDAGRTEEAELFYDLAIESYKKVREMYPNYVQLHFQEGMLHSRMGRQEEAHKSFRRYINIVDPVFPYTYFRLGMIANQKGDTELAKRYFEEPVRRKSDQPETFFNLAAFLITRGDIAGGERVLIAGLEEHPKNTDILGTLASLYEQTGRVANAEQLYQELLRINPNDKKAQQRLGIKSP
ncbi:MAG: tetratricopeptide repeat protein, partial [Elusimicrobia bacterium]|nr:tetratricopeptide repeat protein [Elusimicrobiota bacterium]